MDVGRHVSCLIIFREHSSPFCLHRNKYAVFPIVDLITSTMADNSNQAFLNTLFQWTVKNTAEEKAASATREPVQPMNEEVGDRRTMEPL